MFRILTAKSGDERKRKIYDQNQCGYDLKSEWLWGLKTVLMFVRRVK